MSRGMPWTKGIIMWVLAAVLLITSRAEYGHDQPFESSKHRPIQVISIVGEVSFISLDSFSLIFFTPILHEQQRHSGTNFVMRLLQQNIGGEVRKVADFDVCGKWKHQFQWLPKRGCTSHDASLDETLVVVMLRNPYDWALAMHKNCWCGVEKAKTLAALPFQTYVQMPYLAEKYSWKPWVSPPIQENTRPFANVMKQRTCKLINVLNMSSWVPHIEYVRHEEIMDPDSSILWLQRLIRKYGLKQLNETLNSYNKYKLGTERGKVGFISHHRKSRSVWFNRALTAGNTSLQEDVRMITKLMDLKTEIKMGYGVLDVPGPASMAINAPHRIPYETQEDEDVMCRLSSVPQDLRVSSLCPCRHGS